MSKYNATEAFVIHFGTLRTLTAIHANSNDFGARVTARDGMAVAEGKLAFARRHVTFCPRTAALQLAQAA